MKTIYIFELIRSIQKTALINALEQFARENEYAVRFVSNDFHINSATVDDILVIWNRHLRQDAIAQMFEKNGALVVLFENPYIKHPEEEYYSIAYGYHNDPKYAVHPSELTTERFERLGKTIQPWKKEGDYHLFATQAKSFNQTGIGYYKNRQPAGFDGQVCLEFIQRRKPLRFRTHPNSKGKYSNLGIDNHVTISFAKNTKLDEDLAGAFATIVYSSNTATESLLAGVPVFYCGHSVFMKDACGQSMKNLMKPEYPDNREELFALIAHSQYTLREIADGTMFKVLLDNRP